MADAEPMTVRYNPAVGVVALVVGLLNLVLSVLQIGRGDGIGVLLFVAVLLVLLGVLLLTRPCLRVTRGEVEVLGPIGIGSQRYPFRRLRDERGVPVAEAPDGTRTRVAAQRWFARRCDWEAMMDAIARGRWTAR